MGKRNGLRRDFSAEFKQEAVRRMQERRPQGVSLAQIGRELDVHPDRLRAWARQLAAPSEAASRDGPSGAGRRPTEAEELRRLQRENTRLRQENDFLKSAAIAAERERFPVRLMCAALGVRASGFYAAQGRRPSARAVRDERLRLAVRTVFAATKGRYGSPRIQAELAAAGERTSAKRVARLMQTDGLVARPRLLARLDAGLLGR